MRPRTLDEVVGQDAILAHRQTAARGDRTRSSQSIILWGPPGTGKTTLARVIAEITQAHFVPSARCCRIKEIKEVMAAAQDRRADGRRTIVFVDEIHRFNKAQQDAFLPRVEAGDIVPDRRDDREPVVRGQRRAAVTLEGLRSATSQRDAIEAILRRAAGDRERGWGRDVSVADDAIAAIAGSRTATRARAQPARVSRRGGADDPATGARQSICAARALDPAPRAALRQGGEEHYNLISALHKSMRNSDPDAAVYWVARMLEAGEDPLYIARRLVRFASEDIGNADPQALVVAVAAKDARTSSACPKATRRWPRRRFTWPRLRRATPSTRRTDAAAADAHTQAATGAAAPAECANDMMKELDYGKGYQYAHRRARRRRRHGLPARVARRPEVLPADRARVRKEIKRRLDGWDKIKDERKKEKS
jgi:putative ATPase